MLPIATFHLVLLVLSAATTAGLAVYAWRRRPEPGARPFIGLMVALTVWTACYAVALVQTVEGARLFWERMQWFGIPFVSVAFLWFGLAYTGYDDVLSRRGGALLLVVPVLTVGMVWTNPVHHLVWAGTDLVTAGGLVLAVQEFGAWYWFHFLYAYALIAVGSLLLLRLVVASDYLYLDQSVLLLVGVAVPVVGNAVSVFGSAPLPGIDLTPYALTVTGVTFGHALFRYRLFELVPATRHIGRNVAISDLEDGVVIVDESHRVVYCNDAAADVFDADPAAMLGDDLSAHVAEDTVDFETEDALGELTVDDRTFEVRSSPVTDPHDRPIGHTLVVTDVTGRTRREETLRRQRDELRTLDRINRVIRGVNGALIGATTREEVETAVADQLVDADLYDAVCIGSSAAAIEEFTCRSGEGLSTAGATDGGEDAVIAAMRRAEGVTDPERKPQSLDVADDGTGAGTWTTVSLVYERTVYGVLVVFTTRTDAFGERELAVLDELGETIGHAINAIENRHLLLSDAVVEMELACTDRSAALVGASAHLDCSFELEGIVPVAGNRILAYLSVDGVDPATATEVLADGGVEAVRPVSDDGDVIECTFGDDSVLAPLVEYGANVRAATVESGRAELVVEVAPDADARAVVERVQTSYPETSLLSKREQRPGETPPELPDEALADLTDRQREVLEAAFLAGYFDWPRENTAEEVAESLDISSPTLHNHLRKAQRKILEEVLADGPDRD